VTRVVTESELAAEAERVGAALPPRAVVYLEGELGVGKTTAVRALARGLGVRDATSSPTYALVHRYQGTRGPVFHLDCYRLRSPDEAADLDWAGLLAEGDALLVEWPERAVGWVPPATHRVRLAHVADPVRRAVEFT
jgi:tRNA threonylcarbamoyladenosine biosynthesis protein TsaE